MISIIMPTYNRAYIIERAIKSVLGQTYKDWELIIVDDASTDNTEKVVNKYICSNIRYYINKTNLGANASRNIGAKCAKGEVLAFLDSDNYWPENRLESQIEIWKNSKNERCFLYGRVKICDGKNIKILPEQKMKSDELKKTEILGNVIDLNTLLIGKSVFEEIGGFDEKLPRFQDWELILRMLYCFNLEAIGCEECLSYNEIQENSIGRDVTKYIKACEMILKKYMCSYLPEKSMIDYLIGIWNEGNGSGLALKALSEIGKADSRLLPEAIKIIVRLQEMFSKTRKMEEFLYKWHIKNLYSQNGTIFYNYFCSGSKRKNIAIYGLGKLGELFFDEVKNLPINIVYGIDKQKKYFKDIPIHMPDELEPVDLIVITVMEASEEIKSTLEKRYTGEIISLIELINNA